MISLKGIDFSYHQKPVFQGLSIDFHAGNIYGLMGKNGTGKSTLLSTIAGLLFPSCGTVSALGFTPSKRQPAFLSDIFMVPEEFYLPEVSISAFVRRQSPFYPKFNARKFNDCLKEFGIPTGAGLQQMSYGQKKKVLISFGLATNVSILLLDEPTNGLDIVSKGQFRKLVAGCFDEQKCFIISTHQIRDIEPMVDRITFMDEGKIILDQSLTSIAGKLLFKLSFEPMEEVLYSEPMLRGNAVVVPNFEQEESKIDLEILYKAILENPALIQSLFHSN